MKVDLERLRRIAESEFADIVRSTDILRSKLRVLLTDDSYIDLSPAEIRGSRFVVGASAPQKRTKVLTMNKLP